MKIGEREALNWQKIGMAAVPHLVSIILSVIIVIVVFRRWIAPDIVNALEEAAKVSKTLASLGGLKKSEWTTAKEVEKLVGRDMIENEIPELAGLQLILSESTWEKVEELLEENPEAALQLWNKYGHLLGKTEQAATQKFDF